LEVLRRCSNLIRQIAASGRSISGASSMLARWSGKSRNMEFYRLYWQNGILSHQDSRSGFSSRCAGREAPHELHWQEVQAALSGLTFRHVVAAQSR
jgi:hypothetical protein